jgi:hypothetical protein
VIIFGSVWFLSKKSNQTGFFLKIQNQTETGSNRPVLVRFAYFRTKTGFFGLARFFLVWIRFGLVFSVSI